MSEREKLARQMFETMEKGELIQILLDLGVSPKDPVPVAHLSQPRTYHNPIETLAQAILDNRVMVEQGRTSTGHVIENAWQIVVMPPS